ncbi:MAG TPA: hypothetical protein VME66_15265 [Candidatus Acidoferrales bacterium]|nr:hypothetical protein [Candidatus Acidoferrales bacterium]
MIRSIEPTGALDYLTVDDVPKHVAHDIDQSASAGYERSNRHAKCVLHAQGPVRYLKLAFSESVARYVEPMQCSRGRYGLSAVDVASEDAVFAYVDFGRPGTRHRTRPELKRYRSVRVRHASPIVVGIPAVGKVPEDAPIVIVFNVKLVRFEWSVLLRVFEIEHLPTRCNMSKSGVQLEIPQLTRMIEARLQGAHKGFNPHFAAPPRRPSPERTLTEHPHS